MSIGNWLGRSRWGGEAIGRPMRYVSGRVRAMRVRGGLTCLIACLAAWECAQEPKRHDPWAGWETELSLPPWRSAGQQGEGHGSRWAERGTEGGRRTE